MSLRRCPRFVAMRLLAVSFFLPLLSTQTSFAQTQVREVKVLGAKGAVEIEVEASDRIVPQTQVLTGPDRLVIDFPNAVPGGELRSQSVNLGEVKDVRVGLFHSKPPVTRVVLDLKTAQSFQVFPYGRTVMIKVTGGTNAVASRSDDVPSQPSRPGLVITNYTTATEKVQIEPAARPKLEVSFRDGLLTIRANKATLSEVLFAIQQRSGAQISIPAGAEQEKVVADLGPAPAQEVLAHLLNGSRFNFLILNAASDPRKLDRLILTPRAYGATMAWTAPAQASDDVAADDDPVPPPPAVAQAPPAPAPPVSTPAARDYPIPPPEENSPDQ